MQDDSLPQRPGAHVNALDIQGLHAGPGDDGPGDDLSATGPGHSLQLGPLPSAEGGEPRYVIGSVNLAEFFLTFAISATFVGALVTGHWQMAGRLVDYLIPVTGLIAGGVIAAPVASYLAKSIPARKLLTAVGLLVLALTTYQGWLLLA